MYCVIAIPHNCYVPTCSGLGKSTCFGWKVISLLRPRLLDSSKRNNWLLPSSRFVWFPFSIELLSSMQVTNFVKIFFNFKAPIFFVKVEWGMWENCSLMEYRSVLVQHFLWILKPYKYTITTFCMNIMNQKSF